jgi:hypothetical protein
VGSNEFLAMPPCRAYVVHELIHVVTLHLWVISTCVNCVRKNPQVLVRSGHFFRQKIYWPKGPLIQILCGNYPLFRKHVPNFGPFKSFLGESLVPDLSTSYNSNRPASIKNHQKLTQNLSGGLAALLHYPLKKKTGIYTFVSEVS